MVVPVPTSIDNELRLSSLALYRFNGLSDLFASLALNVTLPIVAVPLLKLSFVNVAVFSTVVLSVPFTNTSYVLPP